MREATAEESLSAMAREQLPSSQLESPHAAMKTTTAKNSK